MCGRGVRHAELSVERANDDARRLYERLGWRVVGPLDEVQRCATPEGKIVEERLEAWLMAKVLP